MRRCGVLVLILVWGCTESNPPPLPHSSDDVPADDVSTDTASVETSRSELPDEEVLPVGPGPCDELSEGASCDDGSLCTINEVCTAGFCTATETLECEQPVDSDCQKAVCDPVEGCVEVVLPDATACNAPCYEAATCIEGACLPVTGTDVACPSSGDPCVQSLVCDPSTGACTQKRYVLACPEGTICTLSSEGSLDCVASHSTLCRPCTEDGQCAAKELPEQGNRCVSYGSEGSFCGVDCSELPCPEGYECAVPPESAGEQVPQCVVSEGGLCECDATWIPMSLTTECTQENEYGFCEGQRGCSILGLTSCDALVPGPEICDGVDNDCNGQTDEGSDGNCGPVGACCLDGECSPVFKASCEIGGGVYQGVGVACEAASCGSPTATGACCIGGACSQGSAVNCTATNGQYQGDGYSCGDVDCSGPVKQGACCLLEGYCSTSTQTECIGLQGTFYGASSSCVSTLCEAQGACCRPGNLCHTTTASDCLAVQGSWTSGLSCNQMDCLLEDDQGACCMPSGGCIVLSQAACDVEEGQFLNQELCLGQCAQPDVGACCTDSQVCTVVPETSCSMPNVWHGKESTCPSACAPPEGACCHEGECSSLPSPACAEMGGDFKGADTTCPEDCENP